MKRKHHRTSSSSLKPLPRLRLRLLYRATSAVLCFSLLLGYVFLAWTVHTTTSDAPALLLSRSFGGGDVGALGATETTPFLRPSSQRLLRRGGNDGRESLPSSSTTTAAADADDNPSRRRQQQRFHPPFFKSMHALVFSDADSASNAMEIRGRQARAAARCRLAELMTMERGNVTLPPPPFAKDVNGGGTGRQEGTILPPVPEALVTAVRGSVDVSGGGESGSMGEEAKLLREMLDDADIWSSSPSRGVGDEFERRGGLVVPCRYTIMDLGSNRGDTLAALLNVAAAEKTQAKKAAGCVDGGGGGNNSNGGKGDDATGAPSLRFDTETYDFIPRTRHEASEREARLANGGLDMESYLRLTVGRLGTTTNTRSLSPGAEEYCFYGVEGNPGFTRELRGLEYRVMSSGSVTGGGGGDGSGGTFQSELAATMMKTTRPIRHVHFFTETVAAATNGPTELFLETVSEHAVGSSLLSSHKYAVQGGVHKAHVEGTTITSLLRRTLAAFDAAAGGAVGNGGDSNVGGGDHRGKGHLILKIDIEGGEYAVMEEALDSGILCEYAALGNRLDLVVEFHKWVIEDVEQRSRFADLEKRFLRDMQSCNVHVTKMTPDWH